MRLVLTPSFTTSFTRVQGSRVAHTYHVGTDAISLPVHGCSDQIWSRGMVRSKLSFFLASLNVKE